MTSQNSRSVDFQIFTTSELQSVNLLVRVGQQMTTILMWSPEVETSLVRGIRHDKQPKQIAGVITDTYFKDGLLFCEVRSLQGSKYYSVKLDTGSKFTLKGTWTLLDLVLLKYLRTGTETKKAKAILLDTTDLLIVQFTHNEGCSQLQEFHLPEGEPSSRSERTKLVSKIARENRISNLIFVEGACESTRDMFKKGINHVVSTINYYTTDKYLINSKELRNRLDLSLLDHEFDIIHQINSCVYSQWHTQSDEISDLVDSRKLVVFLRIICKRLWVEIGLILDNRPDLRGNLQLITSDILSEYSPDSGLLSMEIR